MFDVPIPADTIRRALLDWYDAHARELPWRGVDDPYAVWVSEVMLQQTRVETVIPYFRRWMERFPSVDALADAGESDVLEAWEGLGYYSRARRLLAGAGVVRERFGGALPREPRSLREIPGVGAYTAGAVASIAFGVPVPAVDGNVRRVVARLLDLPRPAPAELDRAAGSWVDPDRPGDFNQALMDLGATVCTPRAPACGACPVAALCGARAAGTVEERPRPARRARVREATFVVLVARDAAGRLLMGRRPDDGLLGGMWAFPEVELAAAGTGGSTGTPPPGRVRQAARELAEGLGVSPTGLGEPDPAVHHRYSHIAATYRPVSATVRDATPHLPVPWEWLPPEDAAGLPLPRVQRTLLGRAVGPTAAAEAPGRGARGDAGSAAGSGGPGGPPATLTP